MQVGSISGLVFNGQIRQSQALNKIKSYANKDSVNRFNALTERAAKVNDGLFFDFVESKTYKMSTNEVATIYNYNIYKSEDKAKDLVYSIEENVNIYSTPATIKHRRETILDAITDYFETKFYPVNEKNK